MVDNKGEKLHKAVNIKRRALPLAHGETVISKQWQV